jgi:hypothetical protein
MLLASMRDRGERKERAERGERGEKREEGDNWSSKDLFVLRDALGERVDVLAVCLDIKRHPTHTIHYSSKLTTPCMLV